MEQFSAVVTTCASRKRVPPASAATAAGLTMGGQVFLQEQWHRRLETLATCAEARDLYMGRGFGLARDAAKRANATLFVVSAGLGLVDAETAVPSYGMTVAQNGKDSISSQTEGAFDAQAWWSAVRSGPFSSSWNAVFKRDGVVLIALNRTYAKMIAPDLEALSPVQTARIRIFGEAIRQVLPSSLDSSIMPYDLRLDTILPGTRTDFAPRALSHFLSNVDVVDNRTDRLRVEALLGRHQPPSRRERPRLSDGEVVDAISRHLGETRGIARILRRLRDVDGVACEQRRFTRLYHVAAGRMQA